MADRISPGDRDLIAGHIEQYGVTQVALGVTAESLVDAVKAKRPLPPRVRAFLNAKTAHKDARRVLVAARLARGETAAEIAETLKFKPSIIASDISALRKAGRIAGGKSDV
jgi:hypothetical protein